MPRMRISPGDTRHNCRHQRRLSFRSRVDDVDSSIQFNLGQRETDKQAERETGRERQRDRDRETETETERVIFTARMPPLSTASHPYRAYTAETSQSVLVEDPDRPSSRLCRS